MIPPQPAIGDRQVARQEGNHFRRPIRSQAIYPYFSGHTPDTSVPRLRDRLFVPVANIHCPLLHIALPAEPFAGAKTVCVEMAPPETEYTGLRSAVLFCGLLVSGPVPWYLWHAALYGPSSANIAMIVPVTGLYLAWSIIAAFWRPRPLQSAGAGCFVMVASTAAFFLLAQAATFLPLPPASQTFKTDGMQFMLLLAYFPWLFLQHAVFLALWSRSPAKSG